MGGSPAAVRSDQLERYLRILGVDPHTPTLSALCDLVQAQACRVPFENISKLYRLKQSNSRELPSLDAHLDGIEHHHFGGTCYACNYWFYRLLAGLAYDVRLCGADMSDPDVHLVTMVRFDDGEYLVDCGYAAPFLRPLPLYLNEDHVIELGRDRYVLHPRDRNGGSRLDLYRDGERMHGYRVKPEPRRIEEFAPAIAESFRPAATFMNAVLLTRFSPNRSFVIHNLTVVESWGREWASRGLRDAEELIDLIAGRFGIARRFTRVALSGMTLGGDAWT